MAEQSNRPFLILTALHDQNASPSILTQSHGDNLERLLQAGDGFEFSGMDVLEISVQPKSFDAIKNAFKLDQNQMALYDLFPAPEGANQKLIRVIGRLLALESIWKLQEQGFFVGTPIQLKLDLPPPWNTEPEEVRKKLSEKGALELSKEALATFEKIKLNWNQLGQ